MLGGYLVGADCFFWPRSRNRQQCPALSPWLHVQGRSFHIDQTKTSESSLAHSLCIIHVQAISSSTRNGILSGVPRKME